MYLKNRLFIPVPYCRLSLHSHLCVPLSICFCLLKSLSSHQALRMAWTLFRFMLFSMTFPFISPCSCQMHVFIFISRLLLDGREAFQVDILYFWGRSCSICPFISSLYVLNLGKILRCYSLKCFRFQCSENRVRVSFPRRCLRADGHQSVSLTHGSALLPQLRCYLCSEFSSIPGPRGQLCCPCSCETSFMFSL